MIGFEPEQVVKGTGKSSKIFLLNRSERTKKSKLHLQALKFTITVSIFAPN